MAAAKPAIKIAALIVRSAVERSRCCHLMMRVALPEAAGYLTTSRLAKNDRSCYIPRMMTKGEETRREIVDRALSLASEVGLEGLSLGNLAADVKLSKSGLFAHFRSKEV